MDYHYKNEFVLSIDTIVLEKFQKYIECYHFTHENGGIIVGMISPDGKEIIVTDVTEPQKKDKSSSNRFNRDEYGHQEIMDQLWEDSDHVKTYLGEWHTHNERIPKPSFIDRRNWINISKRKHNSNRLFFIIVGTQELGVWTIKDKEIVQMLIGKF